MIPGAIIRAVVERMRELERANVWREPFGTSDLALIETMALAALTLKARGYGS